MKKLCYLCVFLIVISCRNNAEYYEYPSVADSWEVMSVADTMSVTKTNVLTHPQETVPVYLGDYDALSASLQKKLPNSTDLVGQTVIVEALISEEGEVLELKILKPALNDEVQHIMNTHLREMKFTASKLGNKDVTARMMFPLYF